jgi:putative protease
MPLRPEILAPAGDPLALRAAIASGADAVYLGMARFNARGRAERFRGVTLESCVRAAHDHGARVYVTLNTLLHDDELPLALELAAEAKEAGADAAIVQDLGFASLLRQHAPDLPLHGSTQMTVHQPDQAREVVERLGLQRIILARECSVDEVAQIAERIKPLGAEVEVFVHGALCFAYSGQCLMSNFAGRRSANRGICAQNCRFDFCASVKPSPGVAPAPTFERRKAVQLISMKDLAAFDSVAALADAGVGSFKIEGRLKGPEYVAEVTRLYRAALDAWEEKRPFAAGEAERAAGRVYSRGFTNGYLEGRVGPSMRGDKRSLEGEPDAIVRSAHRKKGLLLLEPRPGHSVRPGQGYRYAHDRYRGGFRILAVSPGEDGATLAQVRFGSEASGRRHRRGASGRRRPPPPLPLGLPCFLNNDPELSRRIQEVVKSVKIREAREPSPLRLEVSGRAGDPLRARASTPEGSTVEASSSAPLEPARTRELDDKILAEHLGRLGGTPFRLESIDLSGLSAGVFLPFQLLNSLRRELVARLGAGSPSEGKDGDGKEAGRRLHFALPPEDASECRTRLAVCVASPDSLEAAFLSGADRAIVEDRRLLSGDREREEAWLSASWGGRGPWFRLPPVAHDAARDRAMVQRLREVFPGAGIVAGHLGQMALARDAGLKVAADLYLNAYNHRTLEALSASGAERVTLSLEVEAKEAARVRARAPRGLEVEVVVGGAVYSMLTRQDFGLEGGEELLAVSEHGHAYRFSASTAPRGGGTTVLYEARELIGAEALPILAGRTDAVRLDLSHQEPRAVGEIVSAYREALSDPAKALQAAEIHQHHAPAGAFPGHLIRGARSFDRSD